MIKSHIYLTGKNANFKNLFAQKIGFSENVFYFGKTAYEEDIYVLFKTTAVVDKYDISIIGELEDVLKSHDFLEKKLKIKLSEFNDSQKQDETESVQKL